MKEHNTKWVTALFDGQLTGVRRWWVERHVKRCLTCAAEYRHQHHVHEMLRANPPTVEMSDSAEFFWSKVKREIETQGRKTVKVPAVSLTVGDWLGQHAYAMAGAVASVLLLAGTLWFWQARQKGPVMLALSVPVVEGVSTYLPDAVATPYSAPDSNVTVIWISGLPWTPNMSEMQTEFDNPST